MNRMICVYICFVLLGTCSVSCSQGKKGSEEKHKYGDKVEFLAEEMQISPSEELLLKSYSLSSSFFSDTTNVVVGYNYKAHALDFVELGSKKASQLKLNQQGPDGISRRVGGLYLHNLDSIWLCDDTQQVYLLNRKGEIKEKMRLCDGASDEVVAVVSNYAMCVIKLYYNKQRKSLFYAVEKVENGAVKVVAKEMLLEKQNRIVSYELPPSLVEANITSKDYGYMRNPNVSFTDDKIICNYPIESSLYVIDLHTMERKVIGGDSQFTPNQVPKSSFSDYDAQEMFALENVHFHEVMYLPKYHLYARLHVAGMDATNETDRGKLNASRNLLLTLFDKDFRIVNELQLPSRRYSHYTGWCALHDGILLFVDNTLSESEVLEELVFDVYRPL